MTVQTTKRLPALLRGFALALSLLAPAAVPAAESTPVKSPRVTATLISSRDAVAPGERFTVALVQQMAPGWHTYWRNPGDSGEPTRIDWELAEGAAAGEIMWPAPQAIPFEPLVNFGFKDLALLPVEITVPASARPGERFTLSAKASWLVCEKICIPEEGSFRIELPVAAEAVPAPGPEARIAGAIARLPQPAGFKGRLTADGADRLSLALPGLPADAAAPRFFPYSDTLIEHAGTQSVAKAAEGATLSLQRSSAFKLTDPQLEGVLTFTQDGRERALTLVADVDPALVGAAPSAKAPLGAVLPPAPPAPDMTLWLALTFAFAGGLILNLMPCVLPVLFIKALGFAQVARASRYEVRLHGLLFLVGVLATFMALAGLVIALGAGWGFQLQSPPVVILLAVVMALIGFNLIGLFEIGSSVQGVGHGLASRGGALGAFMTGVLAVVVATPCTAPFMGAAMGYAVTQPPVYAMAVFLALALGFAAPVVALSFAPGLLRLLPKPGRWMIVLKQAFAFPMFGAAIWLVWVATMQAGADGALAALVAMLAAGFALWLIGVTRQGRLPLRAAAAGLALALVVATAGFVMRIAVPETRATTATAGSQSWSPEKVAALRAQGRPVFVNFTAAWCITCLANEKVALSRTEVGKAFAALNVASLKADWTNRDASIAAALAEYGRAGVPLYLFYPAASGTQAEVLPQLLTPDMLIEAARRAAGKDDRTAAATR